MSPPALLIAVHGTRDAAGVGQALAMIDQVQASAPGIRVAGGFLELARPNIAAALDELVVTGARDVVVFPSMLFAAGHTTQDIPAEIAHQRRRYPGVDLRYLPHFGLDEQLVAMVAQRIDEVVPAGERDRTAVLLVGRGSSHPEANADLFEIARLLRTRHPYRFVEGCFSGLCRPSVQEGLDRCRQLGTDRLVVVPYFLFTGILPGRLRAAAARFAGEHPEIQVRTARQLWPDGRIVPLILTRYSEATEA
jgi:sirohydrochlorin cobaltochelatase